MFERNSVERGSDSGRKTFAITLHLASGHELSGQCYVAATRTLDEELNAAGAFLDFEPYRGVRTFISKSAIVQISRTDVPKADQLRKTTQFADSADPYTILGVARGSDTGTIRSAYHRLAKHYHPDRFTGLDLPKEMASYASDMARRVNAAYALLIEHEKADALQRARDEAKANAPKTPFEAFQRQAAARYAAHGGASSAPANDAARKQSAR
ncbi:MAG: J domain-containing protein [Pseudomonadota bacterium]